MIWKKMFPYYIARTWVFQPPSSLFKKFKKHFLATIAYGPGFVKIKSKTKPDQVCRKEGGRIGGNGRTVSIWSNLYYGLLLTRSQLLVSVALFCPFLQQYWEVEGDSFEEFSRRCYERQIYWQMCKAVTVFISDGDSASLWCEETGDGRELGRCLSKK